MTDTPTRADLIERLRSVDVSWSEVGEWCAEAAAALTADAERIAALEGEVERLREALGDIARDSNPDWTEKRVYPNDVLDDIHKTAAGAYYGVTL